MPEQFRIFSDFYACFSIMNHTYRTEITTLCNVSQRSIWVATDCLDERLFDVKGFALCKIFADLYRG